MKRVLVFRHAAHEGLGTLQNYLRSVSVEISYCDLYQQDPVPQTFEDFDFIISMGGPMNVDETDRYPFLSEERNFLARSIKAGKPVLGVCLGAQMIARALGARVYKGHSKEIGWYPIRFSNQAVNDPVFRSVSSASITVFHWHGDTFELPPGAVRLSSSELYQNQAFRFNNAYALQFHVEVTSDMVHQWLDLGRQELEAVQPAVSENTIKQDTHKYINSLKQITDKLYRPLFLDLMSSKVNK